MFDHILARNANAAIDGRFGPGAGMVAVKYCLASFNLDRIPPSVPS